MVLKVFKVKPALLVELARLVQLEQTAPMVLKAFKVKQAPLV